MLDRLILSIVMMVIVLPAESAVMTYKDDKAGFDTAVAGLSGVSVNILDFESVTAGTVVSEGSTVEGLTFSSNLPSPFEMGVRGIGSTSGLNSLAVTGDGGATLSVFTLGDTVEVSFAASHAFGFYLVVGNAGFDFLDNDVIVEFGGQTIAVADADMAETFTDPSGATFGALWFGFVDAMATYTTASIRFGDPNDPHFVLGLGIGEFDDFTTTRVPSTDIPEPAIILLIGIGLLSLYGFSRPRYHPVQRN